MALNGIEPDFAPKGDLSLKPWFGNNQGLALPPELDLPVVEAPPPYDAQIKELRRQVGGVFIRQSMKDASGATVMDPATQVTSLHGVSMLDAAKEPFEANLCLAVLRELERPQRRQAGQPRDRRPRQPARRPDPGRRRRGARGRQRTQRVLAAAASLLGPRRVEGAGARPRRCSSCSWARSRIRSTSSSASPGSRPTPRWSAPRPTRRRQRCWRRSRRAGRGRCSCATCARSAATSRPTRCWPPWR